MRLSTGLITVAYGTKVLAADATDYLGRLTELYETYGTDAVNSIANLYETDNSFLQQYQTIAEDLTNRPWFSDLAQVTDAAEASKVTGELWFTSYEEWASSVAGIGGGFYNGDSDMSGSANSQESGSGSMSSGSSGSKSSGSGGSKSSGSSGSKSSGSDSSKSSGSDSSKSSGSSESGSESSGSGSGSGGSSSESSSSGSGSNSGSSSSAGSGANIFYAPFGATVGALILALI